MTKYVIIGNGVAGDSAAGIIKQKDPGGEVTIFTFENYPFYYRPRLIEYVAGKATLEKITLHNYEWYKSQDINLRMSTRVSSVDAQKQTVIDENGTVTPYDRLLLAYGAKCFIPPIKGVDTLKNCFSLKNVKDADNIAACAKKSKKAIIIGGGILGIEVAHAIAQLGCEVIVIDQSAKVLSRQLDEGGSKLLEKMLNDKKINFLLNENTESMEQTEEGIKISLRSGKTLLTDMAVISAGVRPTFELAGSAGIKTNMGIIADNHMQTSVKNIYTAGDVCEHNGRLYGLWMPSKEQGEAAGANMAGEAFEYTGSMPSHKLKVAGIDLVSMGNITGRDTSNEIVKKDSGVYKKAFIENGKIVGSIMVGDISGDAQITKAIKTGASFNDISKYF